jgi:hypothetical protein
MNGDLEWLPPVGQRVQFKRVDRTGEEIDGQECYVISNGRDEFGNYVTTAYFELHGYRAFRSDCFRPIRSEEDRAVEEMMRIWVSTTGTDGQRMQALYRAGYRKQKAE